MKVVTNPAYPFLADFFCHLSDRFETEVTFFSTITKIRAFKI